MRAFLKLLLAIIAFVAGIIICLQWKGTDDGRKFIDLIARPAVVEKTVEVEVVKVVIVSDDNEIRAINQEYRDALLKISVIQYDGIVDKEKIEQINKLANDALKIDKMISQEE